MARTKLINAKGVVVKSYHTPDELVSNVFFEALHSQLDMDGKKGWGVVVEMFDSLEDEAKKTEPVYIISCKKNKDGTLEVLKKDPKDGKEELLGELYNPNKTEA